VLFNEIETGAVQEPEEEIVEQGQLFEKTTVKEHARKKPGRKLFLRIFPGKRCCMIFLTKRNSVPAVRQTERR
jgi:hypothetical protein